MITFFFLLIFFMDIALLQPFMWGEDNLEIKPRTLSPPEGYGKENQNPSVSPFSQKRQGDSPYPGKQKSNPGEPLQKYQFPANSCIDRCHVNYMAYRTVYQGKVFQHKTHSPDHGLECSLCHRNDPVNAEMHGDLIIQSRDCGICHHKGARKILTGPSHPNANKYFEGLLTPLSPPLLRVILWEPPLKKGYQDEKGCLRCHADVRDYINGDLQDVISKIPDWMYKAVSCTDCHTLELNGYSFKAVREHCIECHNPDYGLLYNAWKETLMRRIKQSSKSDMDKSIQHSLSLVQSYGMHNFRLSEILLRSIGQ